METEFTSEFKLRKEVSNIETKIITSSKDAELVARQFYFDDLEIYESFFTIYMNNQNKIIGWSKISQGGITGTTVDPRIIFKYAIESLATGIIMVHNHPSGNLKPSDSDIILTDKIKQGGKILEIKLLDHLILNKECYFSFADNGKI